MAVMSAAVITMPPSAVLPLGDLQPAAVLQLDLADIVRACLRLLLDGKVGESLHLGPRRARLQKLGLQAEELAVVLVADHQPAVAVPEHEGLGRSSIAPRKRISAAWARAWAQALVGDVEHHADDAMVAALVGHADRLAARVDPGRPPIAVGHPEGDVERAVRGRRGARLHQAVAVLGRDPGQQLVAGNRARAAPAQNGAGDVGDLQAVGVKVPLPDAAARGFDGEPKAALAVEQRLLGGLRLAALQQEEERQREPDQERCDE